VETNCQLSLVIAVCNRLGITNSPPNLPRALGTLPLYSANIIGGLLLGFGVTLAGACPGTVLPQIATGNPSGFFILSGGILGSILWASIAPQMCSQPDDKLVTRPASPQVKHTSLSWVLAYTAMCFAIVGLAIVFGPIKETTSIHPVFGGLLIAGAQATSLCLTGNTIGVSSAYGEIAQWLWEGLQSSVNRKHRDHMKSLQPSVRSIMFALGMLAGSWSFVQLAPPSMWQASLPDANDPEISEVRAVLGGGLMLIGAGMAGGCTSGHGISGMAKLGLSSFVSVGAIFAGGVGLAAIVG
jgi:uncharacterized membrane protein YedE/YeeE